MTDVGYEVYRHAKQYAPELAERMRFVRDMDTFVERLQSKTLTFETLMARLADCKPKYRGMPATESMVSQCEKVVRDAFKAWPGEQEAIVLALKVLKALVKMPPTVKPDFLDNIPIPHSDSAVVDALIKKYPFAARAAASADIPHGPVLSREDIEAYVERVNTNLLPAMMNYTKNLYQPGPQTPKWRAPRVVASFRDYRKFFSLHFQVQRYQQPPVPHIDIEIRYDKAEWDGPLAVDRFDTKFPMIIIINHLLARPELLAHPQYFGHQTTTESPIDDLANWAAAAVASSCLFSVEPAIYVHTAFTDLGA